MCQTNSSVSAGRLDDCHSGPQQAAAFGIFDEGHAEALLYPTGSQAAFTEAVERLIFYLEFRRTREAEIAASFRVRAWTELFEEIHAAAVTLHVREEELPTHARSFASALPLARYHPICSNKCTRLVPAIIAGGMATAISGRIAKAGDTVEVVSRDPAKAQALADQLAAGETIGTYGAAPAGDVVVLAVPFGSAASVLTEFGDTLSGKVIIDITNPVAPRSLGA